MIEDETKNERKIMNSRAITPEWTRLGVRILTARHDEDLMVHVGSGESIV